MKITHTEDINKVWQNALAEQVPYAQLVEVVLAIATNDKPKIDAFVAQMTAMKTKYKKSK